MDKPNMALRLYARGKNVPLWKVAKVYGVHEVTLIGWLRKEFGKEDAAKFKTIVDEISAAL